MTWNDLRHFSAFVTAGSLSGAARMLGMEHATVARRIASLEARLNLKLVDRRGRRLVLTAEGEKVAALADRMSETMQKLERLADGARSELRGDVTVSAPPAYAAHVLAPRLVPLRQRHPALLVHLLGETHTSSLARREADIAVRLSRPDTGDLTAVRIGLMGFHLYASPAYIADTPPLEREYIGAAGAIAGSPQEVALSKIASERHRAFQSDNVEIQAALAAAGGGVALLPDFIAEGRNDLAVAGHDAPVLTREIWLAVHSDKRSAAPIRAVIEALRDGGSR